MTAARPPDPQKCSGPGVVPEAAADQERADAGQYAYGSAADQARKVDADRIARAALAGVELVRLADGSWIASRWGMVKPLTDAEVGPWLDRIGAPR